MPEAVIVATARSPIGRAVKGSLRDLRPDDLAATIVRAALDKVPQLDPTDIDDLYLGCGLPGGEQGFNMARVVATLLGLDGLPGATVTRYCASSLQTTRMAFHAIKAGEGDVFVSAGVEMVSPFARGSSDSLPDAHEPGLRRGQRVARASRPPRRAATWHDPREDGRAARHLPRDGSDGREPRRSSTASPARSMDEFGVRSQNLAEKAIADGFWAREITPVTLPDGTVVSQGRRAAAGVTLEGSPASSRSSAPTAGSPPATAARSTTAPPPWSS